MKATQIAGVVASTLIIGSGLAAMVWAASQTAAVPTIHPAAATVARHGKRTGDTKKGPFTPPSILTMRRQGAS